LSLREFIPIDITGLPEEFEYEIDDVTYIFGITYNVPGDFYIVKLYDEDHTAIATSEKLVLNHPLWSNIPDRVLPFRDIVPMDESGKAKAVNAETFGVTVFLYIDDLAPSEDINSPDYVGIGVDDDLDGDSDGD